MDNDAIQLWTQDRQRFLVIYREFLQNPEVPPAIKLDEIRSTENAVRQMGELIGTGDGK